uniref:Uncharacterized protein n=1 Tax=Rhizophora mucronata TaxID=61149 RepID=A0A2P2MZV4_RHIMU
MSIYYFLSARMQNVMSGLKSNLICFNDSLLASNDYLSLFSRA